MVFSSPIFLFLSFTGRADRFFYCAVFGRGISGCFAASLFLRVGRTAVPPPCCSLLTWMNYRLGIWVDIAVEHHKRKLAVTLAIALNIGLLAFFKYINLAVQTVNTALGWTHQTPLTFPHIALPIGISFFTFHALSYVIDIYRRKAPPAPAQRHRALHLSVPATNRRADPPLERDGAAVRRTPRHA